MPFYNKMIKDDAVICSPCVSFLHRCGVNGPKVVPIMSLIKCTESIMHLLTRVKINAQHDHKNYNNTVLGKKNDKIDAVLTGEYGLSLVLINGGYRMTSLLYDDFDCHNPVNWNINGFTEPDRYMSFNGRNIPLSTIFIKNIWRWDNGYVCLPVLYNECMSFVFNKLIMKNIFSSDLININSVLKNQQGINGVAEERIIFHNFKQDSNIFLIYAHYDADNIIKDYVIQTIKTFIYLGYNILFYTASSKIENIDQVPFKIFFVENEYFGTDWKIWLRGCEYIINNKIKTSYIFTLNDSILMPIHGVENFKNTIEKMRNACDFWGHWDSNEIEWHIVGTFIEFKYKMIHDVIHFIKDKIKNYTSMGKLKQFASSDGCIADGTDKHWFISNVEVKFAKYLLDKGYKHNVVIKIDTLDQTLTCPVFHPGNIYKWINNPDSFGIKWKYTISYLNQNKVSPELNYLTRYLHYGKYGYISDAEKMGAFPKSTITV